MFLFFFAVTVTAVFLGMFNDLIEHREKVNSVRRAWKKDRDQFPILHVFSVVRITPSHQFVQLFPLILFLHLPVHKQHRLILSLVPEGLTLAYSTILLSSNPLLTFCFLLLKSATNLEQKKKKVRGKPAKQAYLKILVINFYS